MADINPYLINDDKASGVELTRLPTDAGHFQEAFLQELLFKYPRILPVEQLDEAFAPLVSIGREIANIDNLFISPSGLLTVVETKLWRNPEAHRTVVAQILDYTRTLSNYTYDKLDQQVSTYMTKRYKESLNIYTCIKKAGHEVNASQIEFQAKVQDGLKNGRFILLIVGDKIFPEATQLVEIIQSAPHLQFTMGFVELRFFKLEKDKNWPLIVVPHFVAETNEITRAVVRVVYDPKTPPEIQVETPKEAVVSGSGRGKTNPIVFAASLPSNIQDIFNSYIESWSDAGYTLYWGKVGFSLRVKWKGELISIYYAYPDQTSIVTEKLARQYEFPSEIYQKYKNEIMKSHILGNLLTIGKMYIGYNQMTMEDTVLLLSSTDMLASELSKFSNN